MRVVPLSQIAELQDGETVPSIRGTITRVYKVNTLSGPNGPWTKQHIFVRDAGAEVKVELTGRDPVPDNAKGAACEVLCNDGPKGLSGVYKKIEEYPKGSGKLHHLLRVTSSARIDIGSTAPTAPHPTQQQEHRQYQQPQPEQSMPPQPQPANPQAPSNGDRGQRISEYATRRARDYYRVMESCHKVRVAWDKDHADHLMSDAMFQAAVGTIWITLQRDQIINGGD